jgi:iron uptake system component EfeO
MSPRALPAALVVTGALAALALTACGDDTPKGSSVITVASSDDACDVSKASAKAGKVTFTVKNTGSEVTEFYVYKDGDQIMGEVENIGPGLERKLIVELPAGTYETVCKPGMTGDGIRAEFTVSGDSSSDTDPALKAAADSYEQYIKTQTDQLVPTTQQFVDAVKAGNIEEAKRLFPVARSYWERIEPVAEIFGDLDPAVDIREADLEEGQEFTGFHRIEKALWVENDLSTMGPVADKLMTDVQEIVRRAGETQLTAVQLEIAAPSGKISGEEDAFSHTDLWDIAANLEGSKAAIEALRPYLAEHAPELLGEIDTRFTEAENVIYAHRVGDGYKYFGELSDDDKKDIVTAVNALKEKTSLVAGVISEKK